jgi:hypothetical protein
MDDLNDYTEEDILQAVALHLMIVSKTETDVMLQENIKDEPYIKYYLNKMKVLFEVMQDDYKKLIEAKNENNETLKFVMGDDGITEV